MKDDTPYRFSLVAHSPDIVDYVKQVASQGEYELQTCLVDFDTAAPVAMECIANGAEVIICHGGTGDIIVRTLGAPVVAIDRTDMDVLKAIREAAQVTNEIILAAYLGEEHDVVVMEELLGVRIHRLAYPSSQHLFADVDRLYAQGARALVGGGCSKQYMDRLGGRGFVIAPNRHSVEKALAQAMALARQMRHERTQYDNLMAIFCQLEEGIFCVDAGGVLVFSNAKAEKLLSDPFGVSPKVRERIFKKLLLPDTLADMQPRRNVLVEIDGEQLAVTTHPLHLYSGQPGAVALFRDVSSLQKTNREIGEKLYAQGFTARYSLEDIKGDHPTLGTVRDKIERFASTDAAVLVYGESGSGKELVAHALHKKSRRANKSFVAANFAALPENLLESELFGYEGGAFTGARREGKAGLFELANGGTLFLDEVGEISHEMQLRLLRVLETKEVMRVGGSRYVPVDVRVICATHKPLPDLVAQQRFRLDLYYRLSTLKISVPPLRERIEDALILLQKSLRQYHKPETVFDGVVMDRIREYSWPGNIRELLAIAESYLILLDGDTADPKLFSSILQENAPSTCFASTAGTMSASQRTLKEQFRLAQQDILEKALQLYSGDKKSAAQALGVSYSTLWRMQRSFQDD